MAHPHSSTPAQRAQWVAHLLTGAGVYGVVTDLAHAIGVSRRTLYTWRAHGLAALEAAFSPAPAPTTPALERAILTLWVEGHASARTIARLLPTVGLPAVSLGTISAVLTDAQQRALTWYATHAPPTARVLAFDEIYGRQHGRGYLSVIDTHSLALWAAAGPLPVDADSWTLLLWQAQERGLRWTRSVSDGGAAIAAACRTVAPTLVPQRDVWHLLHRCAQAQGRLDRQVRALEQQRATVARQAARVAAGHKPVGRRPRTDLAAHERAVQAAQQTAAALRYLSAELHRLLEVVVLVDGQVLDHTGRVREGAALLGLLAELAGSAPGGMQRELTQVQHHLAAALPEALTFSPALDAVQAAALPTLGAPGLGLLGWAWQRRAALEWDAAEIVAGLPEAWRAAAADVLTAWAAATRASSAVENWHSILRPHLAVHRRLTDGQLALLGVWHNHRVFERGAHAGASPLQLSGMAEAPTDWLLALGYPPVAAAAAPVGAGGATGRAPTPAGAGQPLRLVVGRVQPAGGQPVAPPAPHLEGGLVEAWAA